jgi:hypothetical protein
LHSVLLILSQNLEFDINVFTPYLDVVASSLISPAFIPLIDPTSGAKYHEDFASAM